MIASPGHNGRTLFLDEVSKSTRTHKKRTTKKAKTNVVGMWRALLIATVNRLQTPSSSNAGAVAVVPARADTADPHLGSATTADLHPSSATTANPHPGSATTADPHPGSATTADPLWI